MHLKKKDIELYLQDVWNAIDAGKYQIAPRAVANDHKGREYETLYIFGKETALLERFGNQERTVSLYIKFNKISDLYVFVISFHEQKYPLSYYFKKI